METKSFNQKLFMQMADDRREKMGLTKDAFARAAGRKGSAYQPWLKCEETLTIEAVIGICELLELRPAWALFGEGPKDKAEAEAYNELRKITDQLAAVAQRVVAPDPNARQVRKPMGVAEVTSQLDWLIANSLVELPRPLWIALKFAHRTAHHEAALLGSEHPKDLYPEIDAELPAALLDAVRSHQEPTSP